VAKDENEDHGVEIEIELEKGNDGTVHPDAKGCMLHEDKKKNGQDIGIDYRDAKGYMSPKDVIHYDSLDLPDARGYMPPEDEDVIQDDGINLSDARGYMPLEDKDKDVIQLKNVASGRTEAHGEMESKVENSSSELIIDLPPAEGVPHCDDCVVMCASDKYKDVIQLKNVASGRTEAHGEMESKVENSSSEIIIDLPPAEGVPHCDDCVVMCASMSGKCFYFVC
jgi:hypothetical protein